MRFLRFCRSLALLSGPCVVPIAVAIPSFVEGCSGDTASCNGVNAGSCGNANDSGTPNVDTRYDGPTSDTLDAGQVDAAEAGGGPRWLPDLPLDA
jgi:hypothetical protein